MLMSVSKALKAFPGGRRGRQTVDGGHEWGTQHISSAFSKSASTASTASTASLPFVLNQRQYTSITQPLYERVIETDEREIEREIERNRETESERDIALTV